MPPRSRRRTTAQPATEGAADAPGEPEAAPTTPSPNEETTAPPAPPPTQVTAVDHAVVLELEEVRRLAQQLSELLERTLQREQRVQTLDRENTSNLLVLLTALGPLRGADARVSEPSKIDEYIEDMCDPEFGLQPARKVILQSAKHILNGYEGLRFPARPRRPGVLGDIDE